VISNRYKVELRDGLSVNVEIWEMVMVENIADDALRLIGRDSGQVEGGVRMLAPAMESHI